MSEWERNWRPGVEAASAKARAAATCGNGHDWTEENTYTWRGQRMCRACRRGNQPPPKGTHGTNRKDLSTKLLNQLMGNSIVDIKSRCHIWMRYTLPSGYAQIWLPMVDGDRRRDYIHRIAWEVFTGQLIPDGWEIDHVAARGCISKACWNVAHLEPVSPAVNKERSHANGVTNQFGTFSRRKSCIASIAATT